MPIVRLEVANDAHVDLVAPRMRSADCMEVLASGGFSPADALRASLAISIFARTVFFDDEAAAIFGIVETGSAAIPWLLTTDTVDRYPLTFWRASKTVLAHLREVWPEMVQAVDARYAGALSWAKRLGFTVGEPEPFGVEGRPFRRIAYAA